MLITVDRDGDALDQIRRGDARGLEALYDQHATGIYSLALAIVRDVAEAEDVTQEVFTQVWTQAPRYDVRRGAVAAWMLVIARSRALDRLRRRRSAFRPGTMGDDVLATVADGAPGVDLQAASAEEAARTRAAVAELPASERNVIQLAYFEGLTQSEIAERTGTPLGTVKTRIRSALRRVREAMGGEQPSEGRAS